MIFNMNPGVVSVLCNSYRLQFRLHSLLRCSVYTASKHSVLNTGTTQIRNASSKESIKVNMVNGPGLRDFIKSSSVANDDSCTPVTPYTSPYLTSSDWQGLNRKVYFEIHGCQMNVNDVEVVWSILKSVGFQRTEIVSDADVILIMTCSIREGAEKKVWNKLVHFKGMKSRRKGSRQLKIGILGCMAERLKHTLLEKEAAVDLIAGPDSYKDLPRLLALTDNSQTAVNVLLSLDETYADIMPVRLNQDAVTAYVTIMRGCDNMCSYCIVPFTRGRERSRPVESILTEIRKLSDEGIKEVTLLGQNVNSYRDLSSTSHYSEREVSHTAKGFKTVYKPKKGGLRFADLLDKVSDVDHNMRIRFTSPHPKDFPDEVLQLIAERNNICRSLHVPAQSGNTAVLERMRRGYSREAYLELIQHIRQILPSAYLSSDFICGFCGETEDEFEDTLSLMSEVRYNVAYLFPYSMREKTTAHRRLKDDVAPEVKHDRLERMVSIYRHHAEQLNRAQVGQTQLILVESESKRSSKDLAGRNDGSIKVIIPNTEIPEFQGSPAKRLIKPGDYVVVKVTDSNSQCLKGVPLHHSTLTSYNSSVTE